MKVAIADYGAGNLRSLSSALARAGVEPVVTTDADVVRDAPLAAHRRGRPRRERGRGARAQRPRRRASLPRRRRAARRGDLRRDAAPVRGERGGRRRARRARGPGQAAPRASRAAHGVERARRRRARAHSSTGSTVPTSTSRTASRPSRPTTRSRPRPSTTTGLSSPPSSPAPSPESSSTPSAVPGRAPASSRTSCDGQEARDPLPRRRRRPGGQGRQLREPPRDGGAGGARAPLLGARCGRARLPRHHRDPRGARAHPRRHRARRGRADDPVHRRWWRHGRRRRARPPARRCGQGRDQPCRVRRARDPHDPRGRVRVAGRRLRDRRPAAARS